MGTETAGTEINFCLFFCSHDFIFPFLSLFSGSPSVPYNEYSKWRVLGTWGETQAVLGISIKCKELVSVLTLFQLHLLLSAVQWGKQRGGEQRLCAVHTLKHKYRLGGTGFFPSPPQVLSTGVNLPYKILTQKGIWRRELPAGGRGDGRKHRQQTK